ncbi:MAG: restriction endonuclease subunit S [Comamonadaceae bacterium]|nr:MAG: restriction endonuclease subunit S [Comamonadaceae bacterium]
MSLNLDRTTWKRVRFGTVVDRAREQWDQIDDSVGRYVAGGHFDDDAAEVTRYGIPDDGGMGSTFTYIFEPGDVLYVSASWYLRKTAVATFRGVVADKTYVLRSLDPGILEPRFLPWVLRSDALYAFAAAESTGSMNARILWSTLSRFEFALPPLAEQRRLADLLWATEHHRRELASTAARLAQVREAMVGEHFSDSETDWTTLDQVADITSGLTLGPNRASLCPVPYLRVANVQRGSLDLAEIKEVGASETEQAMKRIQKNDVLVVEGHASNTEVGRAALWTESATPLFQNHLFRVRSRGCIEGPFIAEYINGPLGRAYIRTVARSTSGLNTINSTVLKAMPFPNASRSSQSELLTSIHAIDAALGGCELEASMLRDARTRLIQEVFG